MRNKKITWLAISLVLAILIVTFTLKIKNKPSGQTEPAEAKAKLVVVETVTRDKAQRLSEISATLEADNETLLSFEVPGQIVDLPYKEGDRVKSGTVLARVNATEFSLQVAQADAGLNKARVGYQQAQQDFDRIEQLYREGVVAQSDYEKARDGLQVAEEDYLQAQQSADLLEQDKTSLIAPIDGTILVKYVTRGQITSAGSPVYSIGRLDPLKAVLPIPDNEIANWHQGDKVQLTLYGAEREGRVSRIYPSTNSGTGTVGVEVTVANLKQDWLPGQVVMANRPETREGLYVPVSAVINRGEDKPYVFLAIAGKAVKRSVTIGELFGDNLEITSGLTAGDRIVVKGADQLFEGDAIEDPGGNGK